MIAYSGDLTIQTGSQGLRKLLKRAVTGEGVPLMEVTGRGEIWLADLAKNVLLIDGDGLAVAGKSVLCFDESLQYEIRLVKGAGMNVGGLFNCELSGAGSIAITAHGQPVVFSLSGTEPVYVDTDAVIGWTSSLTISIHRSESAKSLIKGGSGEMFQLKLQGEGSVIVQPSDSRRGRQKRTGRPKKAGRS